MRVVGTNVTREVELLLDGLVEAAGRRRPRILQIGYRASVSRRNELNWRGLIGKRFGYRA